MIAALQLKGFKLNGHFTFLNAQQEDLVGKMFY